ncbi:cysteine desulfurase family protein [Eggerthella guodeyinii]|uniref:cysteine desulfurase n=1 Tax=Eggerthella guodeyinii TaxID=2690837 RepID=A0A6N7RPC1_9ACTN|nr:cysteine desulfurase family protein [Eggerthella guodeyinii]MRX83205.1 aminotransferase class V-fold PLP-dependent enzyme [Eggerthella guodeyinii]
MASMPEDYVYLDYAATAPLCEEAAAAMAPYFVPGRANLAVGGNANSLHASGRAAFAALEDARKSIARDLGARRPDEIVFTGGATEADDAALLGIAQAAADERRRRGAGAFAPHVVVTAVEHDAVLAPAKRLEAQGFRVTRLVPDRQGFVEVRALEAALDDDVVLVSVQAANSEVGSIQPIAELARVAHAAGALFHTDAVQALGKVPVNLQELDVDAASFSAHKVGGPKGVGALYLRARTPFQAYAIGGGQESGRRSGTQNVAGIVGFAAAVRATCAMQEDEAARLRALRDKLYAQLGAFDAVEATVDVEPGSRDFLPNVVHVLVDGLESETLILRFDMQGFGVSGGSACSSHSLEPSHVLRALGIDADRAHGALRISLGRYTTEADVDAFVAATAKTLAWN